MSGYKFYHYLLGYLIGILIFFVAIPGEIWFVSQIYQWDVFPSEALVRPWLNWISIFVFLTGLFFMVWTNVALVRKGCEGTTESLGISASPKTKHLAIKGPYRYTRNPMVFGVLAIYYSLAIFLNSWVGLAAAVLITLFAVIYLKASEEKRLVQDFGDAYMEYKRDVSMIVPFPNQWHFKRWQRDHGDGSSSE